MCGIVSVISKRSNGFFNAELELFESMLIFDTTRGLDSTGVFCVDSSRQLGFMKVASHPFHLFQTQEYPKWRTRAVQNGRILVGHNRKATQGSINSQNAHPFHSGNIVLVHNGTLRGDHKKDYAPVDVDSHALTIAFDEEGAENVIPKINGAFALIWWNVEKQRLYAVRNDERPLELVETDDNYFLLSESWMVTHMLTKQNKKFTVTRVQPGKLHEFQIGGKLSISDIEVQQDYWSSSKYSNTGRVHNYQSGPVSSVEVGKSLPAGQTEVGDQNSPSKRTTSPSSTTALTLVKKDPAPDQSGADREQNTGGTSTTNVTMPVDMANHVPCAEFTKGQAIQIKLYEMKLEAKGALYFCRGKVAEPDMPEIDVAAYIKVEDIAAGTERLYTQGMTEGMVQKHTTSVCGRSLYVSKVTLPTFVNVHNNRITETDWNYITTHCKCSTCAKRVFDEDREYTSVVRRPANLFNVTCADCVEETLKGELKHEFTQNRLASLQAYQQQCDALGRRLESGAETPSSGSSALH